MPHEITLRDLTQEERVSLKPRGHGIPDLLMTLAMSFFLAIGISMGVGVVILIGIKILRAILGRAEFAGDAPTIGMAFTLLPAWIYLVIRIQRRATRARGERAGAQVEVIHVDNARFVQNDERVSESPAYYFDIGGGTILVLMGQWLWDFPTYGLKRPDDEESEASVPFPCASFRVHRLKDHGRVLRIDLLSPPIRPEGAIPDRAKLPAWLTSRTHRMNWACSLLVEGSYEAIRAGATLHRGS